MIGYAKAVADHPEEDHVAKHLPAPSGQPPDPQTMKILDMIEEYRDSGLDPAVIAGGLRHVYYVAETAWDFSLARAKRFTRPGERRPIGYAELVHYTGDKIGTLQGRIQIHEGRVAAGG